ERRRDRALNDLRDEVLHLIRGRKEDDAEAERMRRCRTHARVTLSVAAQRDNLPDRPGPLVPRLDPELAALRGLDHPLELREIRGRVVSEPRERAPLVDAPGQLAGVSALLAGD